MKPMPANPPHMVALATAAVSLALVASLGLAMWLDKGTDLLISLVEMGLQLCF